MLGTRLSELIFVEKQTYQNYDGEMRRFIGICGSRRAAAYKKPRCRPLPLSLPVLTCPFSFMETENLHTLMFVVFLHGCILSSRAMRSDVGYDIIIQHLIPVSELVATKIGCVC